MATQTTEPQHDAPQPADTHLWDYVHILLRRRRKMVPRKAVLHTLERIHDTGARILGIVLNRAQVDKHAYYYSHYYGHYYGHHYGTQTPKRHKGRHGGNGKIGGSEAAGKFTPSEEEVARVQ